MKNSKEKNKMDPDAKSKGSSQRPKSKASSEVNTFSDGPSASKGEPDYQIRDKSGQKIVDQDL